MTDYIDREELLKAISKIGGSPLSEWDTVGVVSLVANQPAADVAPVRRGHWERHRDIVRCSNCEFGMFPLAYVFDGVICEGTNVIPGYCPKCGAKMEVPNDD